MTKSRESSGIYHGLHIHWLNPLTTIKTHFSIHHKIFLASKTYFLSSQFLFQHIFIILHYFLFSVSLSTNDMSSLFFLFVPLYVDHAFCVLCVSTSQPSVSLNDYTRVQHTFVYKFNISLALACIINFWGETKHELAAMLLLVMCRVFCVRMKISIIIGETCNYLCRFFFAILFLLITTTVDNVYASI